MNLSFIIFSLLSLGHIHYTDSQEYITNNTACKKLDKKVYEFTDGACHISGNKLDHLSPEFNNIFNKPNIVQLIMECNKEIPKDFPDGTQSIIQLAKSLYANMECETIQRSSNLKILKKVCAEFKKDIDKNQSILQQLSQ